MNRLTLVLLMLLLLPACSGEAAAPTATTVPPTATAAPTETPSATDPPAAAELGDTWTRPADGAVMVYVPAGSFMMGNDAGNHDEAPSHRVEVASFWLDQTEVSNARYDSCVAAASCEPSLFAADPTYNQPTHPVVGVNWAQADVYCAWVGMALPTEVQWEFAARGPESRLFPWGDAEPDEKLLNFSSHNGGTQPVGSYPAGASWVGALDMAGNADEWTASWFLPYPGNEVADGLHGEIRRIYRGGAWNDHPEDNRAAGRAYAVPTHRQYSLGFRCASTE